MRLEKNFPGERRSTRVEADQRSFGSSLKKSTFHHWLVLPKPWWQSTIRKNTAQNPLIWAGRQNKLHGDEASWSNFQHLTTFYWLSWIIRFYHVCSTEVHHLLRTLLVATVLTSRRWHPALPAALPKRQWWSQPWPRSPDHWDWPQLREPRGSNVTLSAQPQP